MYVARVLVDLVRRFLPRVIESGGGKRHWRGCARETTSHVATLLLCWLQLEVANCAAPEAGQRRNSPNKKVLGQDVAESEEVAKERNNSLIHFSVPSFVLSLVH